MLRDDADETQSRMNHEVFTMSVEGTDRKRLTVNIAADMGDDWSPDGTRIAFSSLRDGNGEIYIMNVDGTEKVNLTRNDANDHGAAWSPFIGN